MVSDLIYVVIVKITNRCFTLCYLSLEDRALIVGFDAPGLKYCILPGHRVLQKCHKIILDESNFR